MVLDRYCSFYDYWHPPTLFKQVNFESFLYGFLWGGISSKLYEVIRRKEFVVQKEAGNTLVPIIVFSSFLLYMLLLGALGMNSVLLYVSIMLLWTVLLLIKNRRLIPVSMVSGIFVLFINAIWYAVILLLYPTAIQDIWLTGQLSGLYFLGLPLEEHLYIFSLGALGSIVFKIAARPKINPNKDIGPSGILRRLIEG